MIALLLALTAYGTDLDQARSRAVIQASSVEIARADADAARARSRAKIAANLPSIAVFADVTVGSGYTSIGFERPVPWQSGVGVRGTWTVLDPSGWAAATAARRTAQGRAAMLEWTRSQARQEATVAYAEAQATAAIAASLASAAQDANKARDAVQELVTAGIRPAADSVRAQADALDLLAQAETARGESLAACARLQGLIDDPVDGRCTVEPVAWSLAAPAEGPPSHPAIRAFSKAAGAASASASSTLLSHMPTVGASGTAAQYAVPDRTGPGWSASVSLDVPLSIATTGLPETAAARAEHKRAVAEVAAQQRDLAVATVQAEARLSSAKASYGARVAASTAATEAWRRVDARFSTGLEDLTTWLSARRARIEAEVAVHRAAADLAGAIAAVESARGVP